MLSIIKKKVDVKLEKLNYGRSSVKRDDYRTGKNCRLTSDIADDSISALVMERQGATGEGVRESGAKGSDGDPCE